MTPVNLRGYFEYSRISGRASRTFGRASQPLPDIREGLPTTPANPGGSPENSQDIWEGPPTTYGYPGVLSNHSRTSGRVS